MKKAILLLALISSPVFSSTEKEIKFCSRLGALTTQISKDIYKFKLLPKESKTYNSIESLDNSNPEIRKSILYLIRSSEKYMSHETKGSFYTHACLYNYITNKTAINKLSPIVGSHCDKNNGDPACINNVVSSFASQL